MEEKVSALSCEPKQDSPELISVCDCLLNSSGGSESDEVPLRKQAIFSTVSRTEEYLRERRIPKLMRFILSKIIASGSDDPVDYTCHLLDECMIFRSRIGRAPVLFEQRHLEAVVKSFDPGNRGWLSCGQVRRAFITLGLMPPDILDERIPTADVLELLNTTQENELFSLLSAGSTWADDISSYNTESTSKK